MAISINLNKERYGHSDGAHWIHPAGLTSKSTVFSVGVGINVSFDIQLIEEHGCIIHAFDPTPESIDYVRTRNMPPQFNFHPVGLSSEDGEAVFFPPKDSRMISHRMHMDLETGQTGVVVPVRTLTTLMEETGVKEIDILKLDIEGAEYEVIPEICSLGKWIKQVCIEFHHFFPDIEIERTIAALKALRDSGFEIFSQDKYNYGLIQVKSSNWK